MIYLEEYSQFKPPVLWLQKAEAAQRELEQRVTFEEKIEYIENHDNIWQDPILKEALLCLSHYKCWYCEALEDRSSYHVDHFRPKKRIRYAKNKTREGYWWLAFDWRNYRLACQFCNTSNKGTRRSGPALGKADWFPLLDESQRVTDPNKTLRDEMPCLLDPTVPGDPELLIFSENDGEAKPAEDETDSFLWLRAEKTIYILHLNEERIVRARKKLWERCNDLIVRGDLAYIDYKAGSPGAKQAFQEVTREIYRLIDGEAPFSATARSFFRNNTKEFKWLRNFL
jgi:uncharacterized protein (TIGR02646 family)